MSMRISSALLLALALAACGERNTDNETLANVEAQQRAAADDDGLIECAPKGAAFTRSCTVDRTQGDQGLVLTLRHKDGAFHRLLVTRDGRGVIAADGAEKAVVTVLDAGRIEVALAGDRYRLPATVKGAAKPS
jgi:hypothetical protein